MKVRSHPRVDKQIRLLTQKDSSRIVRIVEFFAQYGFTLSSNYLKKLSKNLWELRTGRWRLLLGVINAEAIVVNIFLKKTQKTPIQEIELSLKRMKDYE